MIRALPAALALLGAATGVAVVAPAASAAAPATCAVSSAELSWGFKESFRAYIDGSIANGSWEVSDGATYATPDFGFSAAAGTLDPREPSGQIDFPGAIRFTGHGGILDTTLANPSLILGDGEALLLLDVSGPTMQGDAVEETAVPFVELDLSDQDLTPIDGIITLSDVPTTLTADGSRAFPNYEAGTAFDPVTIRAEVGDCALAPTPSPEPAPSPVADATPAIVAGGATLAVLAAAAGAVVVARRRRA